MTATPAEATVNGGAWDGFKGGLWRDAIDVRDFVQQNYTPYEGDGSFLAGPTERTSEVWRKLLSMFPAEIERGIYDVDVKTPSRIDAFGPGYVDGTAADHKDLIVGLQTDAPLRRAIMPNGGWRMVEGALNAYGYEADPEVRDIYTHLRKTHNEGVFDAYTPEIRACRSSGIITGLPDAYGRGRIIGDYRRVALYGVDHLIAAKEADKAALGEERATEDVIRGREEISEQIKALRELKAMAMSYGYDIAKPATTGREAIQWLYFAYLAAVKEQNGAAMSIGRIDNFLDIYLQRDIDAGRITEEEAQEYIDDFVIKLRIVRFLRTPEYNELYSGDPTWVTWSMAGIGEDGRPLVSRTTFRALQTLYNLGPAPEPNLTVFWSQRLPQGFKEFASRVAIDTSAIQFESDELMRPKYGDDTAIACCVSAMAVGKQMQFFGARVNVAKALLYAINGGRDEKSGKTVVQGFTPIEGEYLDYATVVKQYDAMLDWLAKTYVHALNVIHYMHDKYAYERIEMALHDQEILRTMACGIAGLSVAADSLSAIKHAKVKVVRDETGLAVDYEIEGDYPAYGNNDDRADDIARRIVHDFMQKVRKHPTYRNAVHTQSVLTITSNVVYGKKTGNTPDGRRAGMPFAPGANPMNGRDEHGYIASAMSVAKLPYDDAEDGISLTNTITPDALGRTPEERIANLAGVLDGFMASDGFHMNVNVLDKATLEDAMEHPENYPQLTIRVSGYAVNFIRLTRDQQLDVINRTFHGSL
ncbi:MULTISPECIES: formate C-acetyltransferase [unclassified Streptomyces]|uniref:formate C-acetyltransferase n=1 Tax=unclassified Streptomyces TaxID=2593676 RepID=UPI00137034D5|nr:MULTISPECIES: formate C-acetyltransferase [unclassified Streptomyces]NEA04779.1 formate C-acetyltransferase [Streptomyces sp. SID10116]MYY81429.1 formate C-acetyltransferase [Streptomyces sp. SID335]MYZ19221.1 formate C-acetyltransferase [Streptomyces sp. SID337]NDZ91253.1 formate C-acetyltransferase [Streptomyces sp. SID10115]NEB49422.1 formate C-acetyltransferase [Streptomyces sp. SID339]